MIAPFIFIVLTLVSCTQDGTPEPPLAKKSEPEMTPGRRLRIALRDAPEKVVPLFEARSFSHGEGGTMPYRLLQPSNYDSQKDYPLVVCLAGSNARGNDNVNQVVGAWASHILVRPENRENYPCFILVPQCPSGSNWGYSVPDSVRARWQDGSSKPIPPGAASTLFALIDELRSEFSIDDDRIYVTGHAMGGYGTWHFIISRPDLFAAAVPVTGGADAALAQTIAHVPVWAFHGEEDGAVPIDYSRDIITAMKTAGGNPRYTVFPGGKHLIWPLAYDEPELLDWLFAQKRGSTRSDR